MKKGSKQKQPQDYQFRGNMSNLDQFVPLRSFFVPSCCLRSSSMVKSRVIFGLALMAPRGL